MELLKLAGIPTPSEKEKPEKFFGFNINYESKLENTAEDQKLVVLLSLYKKGRHIKVIKDIHLLLSTRKAAEATIEPIFHWRFLKRYCVSSNKVALTAICSSKF